MPGELWEWTVERGTDEATTGVCRERDRAVEALSRTLAKAGGPASGRLGPVALVEDASGWAYRRHPALEVTADYESGVIKWT